MPKILIAEDDKALASVLCLKLVKSGYEVKLVGDGQEALNCVVEFKPDLIILDLVMPVKNGWDTLAELRENSDFANTPILVASNLGQVEDITKARKMGATDYVVKSDIKLEDLISKIKTLLP